MGKRLLVILASLNSGGAETFMMKLFRSLPKDYKIDFIVSAKSGFYEKEVVELGGRIFRVPLRTKEPIKTFKAIYDVVKQNHYTHILKLCDTPIGLYDLLAARMGGAKVLCVRSCNAGSSTSKLGTMVNDFLRPFLNYIADVKLAPSRLAAEFTFGKAEVEAGKVNFIHNGVDLNVYKYVEENRRKVRREFGIADEQFVVGHIGRFNQQKNHKFLIDVFAEVLKQKPNALLMLRLGTYFLRALTKPRRGICRRRCCHRPSWRYRSFQWREAVWAGPAPERLRKRSAILPTLFVPFR